MSDYLGNLVARSLDPVPAFRPRLASRFEPLGAASPPLWASPAAEEPGLVEEAVEVRAEPPRPRRSRRRVAVEEMEEGREAEAAEGVVPRRRGARRRGVPFEASPPGPLSSGAGEGEGREPAPPAEAVAQTRVARRRGVPFEASSPVPLSVTGEGERSTIGLAGQAAFFGKTPPLRPPSPVTERGTGGEASRVDRSRHEEVERAAEAPRNRGRVERQPADDRPPAHLLQPRVTLMERPPAPVRAAAPAVEPVIQVTIGRIEVRATQPAPQPSRPRSAAPNAMSLEEYLRRRSRRGE